MVHKKDDGFSKDAENGLNIYNLKSNPNLISFYADVNELHPYFQFTKDKDEPTCLKLKPFDLHQKDNPGNSFFFDINGNLGIGKKPDENLKIDIGGIAGMQGRYGTYVSGKKPADSNWHTIIDQLDNCHAFEIVARAGEKGTGKFSLMHATALSSYGPSGGRIRKTTSYFGSWWVNLLKFHKLNLRWSGTIHNYSLQIKTKANYGKDTYIHYSATQLWDDKLFLEDQEIYNPNR